ncbi:MAG: FGGY-family carbohydrate kinase [Desulfobacterales bacterium]|nr:FGGY-family carbohydrate kinase [Desulfobacterales bacterium]
MKAESPSSVLVMAYDVGTTGAKTCLYELGSHLNLLDSQVEEYPLFTTADGGAEQRAEDWWQALCRGSAAVLERTGTPRGAIKALSFCCQMQALILVDDQGRVLRNPMGYMDGRATRIFESGFARGFPRVAGLNARKLLTSLYFTGGAAATAKDPLWKYHWVKHHEPEVMERACQWLDVRDYLALCCTGKGTMTRDSAHLTFLYDTRPGREGWSKYLCGLFGVDPGLLPGVQGATDLAGELTAEAAADLGLAPGCPVFCGGGDITLIPMGSGCLEQGDIHAYVGTSGWVVAHVEKRMVDVGNFMASICGAMPGAYNFVAEQETSGLCLQWVRDHLAVDSLGVYKDDQGRLPSLGESDGLYDLLNRKVAEIPPGSGGVIFTPWLHGNRAPKEDPFARGMFFNLGLKSGKRAMIRAVLEGMAFHKRWMLEAMEKRIGAQDSIRLVGGGAKSDVFCQIMADITQHTIEVPRDPQNAGAAGAALICGLGLGQVSTPAAAKEMVHIEKTFVPDPETTKVYDPMFEVFQKLYAKNRKLFHRLNR